MGKKKQVDMLATGEWVKVKGDDDPQQITRARLDGKYDVSDGKTHPREDLEVLDD